MPPFFVQVTCAKTLLRLGSMEGCDMRKIITSALMAATFIGTLATATTASAQDWGGPPPPPPYGWDRGPQEWGGPPPPSYEYDWRARREWQIRRDRERRYEQERRYEEARRRDWCRWNRCY